MAIITNLATLKAAVADTLNRDDLTSAIDIFIQSAEQVFQRDPRVRDPANNAVIPSLFATDPNWLITAHPDVYLYGALVESAPYLKDDARIATWAGRLELALEGIRGSVRLDPARTLALTTYAELQTMVADALERGDLKNVIPVLIVQAEGKLRNDRRVRSLLTAPFSITADDLAVPSDFRTLESWYHDGPTYYGPIEIVGADQLGILKASYGTTGVPSYAAILGGVFRFAPAPTGTYATKMTYWRTLTALSAGVNWLYTGHPHIYLRAALAEAGPYVARDPVATKVVAEAREQLELDLEALHQETWDHQWSGTMRRQFTPIGG